MLLPILPIFEKTLYTLNRHHHFLWPSFAEIGPICLSILLFLSFPSVSKLYDDIWSFWEEGKMVHGGISILEHAKWTLLIHFSSEKVWKSTIGAKKPSDLHNCGKCFTWKNTDIHHQQSNGAKKRGLSVHYYDFIIILIVK